MKLMIVDDEPIVRNGLRRSIPWEQEDIHVVAEAGDGKTALMLAVQFRPDIIICDIRMPQMDGITFVSELHQLLPDTRVIMLTAYAKQEYMLEAIRCGVSDFLLKPAGFDQILSTVKRLKDELLVRRRQISLLEKRSRLLTEDVLFFREHYLRAWLKGSENNEKMREAIGLLEIPLSGALYQLLLTRTQKTSEWIFMQKLSALLEAYTPVTTQVELGSNAMILNIPDLQSTSALRKRLFEEKETILGESVALLCPSTESLEQTVAMYAQAEKMLSTLPETACEMFLIMESSGEWHTFFGAGHNEKQLRTKISALSGHEGRALRYLEKNYRQDLNLEQVSQALFLSPTYISRLLSERTERSFVGWLRYFRIEKAKECFSTTQMKNYEVAEEVGYKSYKVFSENFLEETGVTIGMWRSKNKLDGNGNGE